MNVEELMRNARDAITVKRVYGDPYEKDGTTIIPAAAIRGGVRAGTREQGRAAGGFGLFARPLGVYVLRDGKVLWRPAVDVARMLRLSLIGFAIASMLTVRLFARRRGLAFRRRSPRRMLRAFLAR